MIDTYDTSNTDRPTIIKDPQAVLDYAQDWAAWLQAAGDTLASATVDAEASLVTQGPPTIDAGTISVMVGGGTPGKTHRLTFTVVTAGGRTDQRSVYLRIKDR